MRIIACLLLWAFTLGGVSTTLASDSVEEHGARFERVADINGNPLSLAGTGVAKYRIVFTVYAAGLYLPEGTSTANVLSATTPRRLEIEYFHNISAEDIIRAANTKLESQLTADELAVLQPAIDRFHDLYQAVTKGDRYRMDYQPGIGTTLSFNGQPVGTVAGGDFATAYFGIWLDQDDPLSPKLREALLASIKR